MNPPPALRRLPLAPGLLAVPLLLAGAGCSTDTHPFVSTVTAPLSVDVTYVQSGETAWSMDIPEGHKLELDFDRPGEGFGRPMPDRPATSMEWKLKPFAVATDARGNAVEAEDKRSGKVDLNGLPIQMNARLRNVDETDRGDSGLVNERTGPVTTGG